MVQYKLYYFDSRGRAEYVRYVFALAGVEYEDIRVSKDDWPTLKETMPFGQLPVLEIDGKLKIAQSYPIARYIAEKYGLAGKTLEDRLKIDMLVACQEDMQIPLIQFAREQDKDKKAEHKQKFEEKLQPAFLANFEKLLKENNGGDAWFVGDEISWADLAFLHGTSWPMEVFGMHTPWADYPKIHALKKRVESHPKIKAWIENRPKTPW